MPGEKQAWPNVAACWSPATAAMGTGPPNHSSLVLAVNLARPAHLRQHGPGHAEDPQQFVVPIQGVNIVEQRAAGVAVVGRVDAAAGQSPEEPRIDCAEKHLAPFGTAAEAVVWCPASA